MTGSLGIRVEQWSAADAKTQTQPTADSNQRDSDKSVGAPSLLETLRAAAAPDEKVKAKPVLEERATLATGPQDVVKQKTQNSQVSEDTQFAAQDMPCRPGKSSLQSLAVKRNSLKQKGSLPGPESPATPCSLNAQTKQRMVHKARTDLRAMEESIPWEAVHDSWKESRQPWRKSLRQAETVPELLGAMDSLRKALATEKSQYSHQSAVWDQQLKSCIETHSSIEEVLQLLTELRATAKQWTRPKQKEAVVPFEYSKEQKLAALHGMEALWQATQHGPTAVMQCPLEAILDYDPDVLRVMRQLLEKEMALLASNGKDNGKSPALSIFAHLQSRSLRPQRQSPAYGTSSSGEMRGGAAAIGLC